MFQFRGHTNHLAIEPNAGGQGWAHFGMQYINLKAFCEVSPCIEGYPPFFEEGNSDGEQSIRSLAMSVPIHRYCHQEVNHRSESTINSTFYPTGRASVRVC